MRWLLIVSFVWGFSAVTLNVNPAQNFNDSDNYANRVVYFFVQVNTNGSVTLQVSPPPFYPGDTKYFNAGFAYIDCDDVIQNYTASQVANATEEDISFTIKAFANTSSSNGYKLYAQAYQWMFSLDPKSVNYYQLQQFNNAAGTNPNIGGFALYSDLLHMKHWVSNSDGVLLTESETDSALLNIETPKTDSTYDFTLRIDFSQFANAPAGIYSLFFFFQMTSQDLTQPFSDTLNYYLFVQQTQLNYLYNNILWIDGYLDGTSTLYDPSTADQVIIKANRQNLIDQYNSMLAVVTAQWEEFAALPNLSSASQTAIYNMQQYLITAEANTANF